MNKIIINKPIIFLVDLLIKGYYSKREITCILNIKPATLSRYLTIIKNVGFELIKYNKKYKIIDFKNKIELMPKETSILAHLFLMGDMMFSKNNNEKLQKILNDILFLSTKENYKETMEKQKFFASVVFSNKYKNKINEFQKHLDNDRILNVETKNNERYILKPIKITWGYKKIFFVFEDVKNKQIREFSPFEITKMQENKISNFIQNNKETIFELYGAIAKNYLLKEEEKLIDVQKDKIIVANYSQDKIKLFKRLLKYDVLCKIIQPKKDVEDFKKFICIALDNIT